MFIYFQKRFETNLFKYHPAHPLIFIQNTLRNQFMKYNIKTIIIYQRHKNDSTGRKMALIA